MLHTLMLMKIYTQYAADITMMPPLLQVIMASWPLRYHGHYDIAATR